MPKIQRDFLFAERTLAGAVDSFLHSVVHVRPNLMNRFEEAAANWMDAWFAAGGANQLEAVDGAWTRRYVAALDAASRASTERFLHTFYLWAIDENLVDSSPLAAEFAG